MSACGGSGNGDETSDIGDTLDSTAQEDVLADVAAGDFIDAATGDSDDGADGFLPNPEDADILPEDLGMPDGLNDAVWTEELVEEDDVIHYDGIIDDGISDVDMSDDTTSDGISDVDMFDDITSVGACLNSSDMAVMQDTSVQSLAFQCAITCVGEPSCTQTCILGGASLSVACAQCVSSLSKCVIDKCLMSCIEPTSEPCIECTQSQCGAEFLTCSGVELT